MQDEQMEALISCSRLQKRFESDECIIYRRVNATLYTWYALASDYCAELRERAELMAQGKQSTENKG
jgi:hypothetical protein